MKLLGFLPVTPGQKGRKKQAELSPVPWHTAFMEAIQLELGEYKDVLEFHSEHQLSTDPLRIDCVIIKKAKAVAINKNIATIFREVNILEYKSPGDYVSIHDFYKVYAYACLYASIEKVPITSLTITFIESHYPRELLSYLKKDRNYRIEKKWPGIYIVTGDILPIQIIDSRKLPADENLWLKGLSNQLTQLDFIKMKTEIVQLGKGTHIEAYLYAVARANAKAIQEAIEMRKSDLTIEQVFENVGWIAKWEARGEARAKEREALAIAQKMVNLGLPPETVVSATELDPEKVKALYLQNK